MFFFYSQVVTSGNLSFHQQNSSESSGCNQHVLLMLLGQSLFGRELLFICHSFFSSFAQEL